MFIAGIALHESLALDTHTTATLRRSLSRHSPMMPKVLPGVIGDRPSGHPEPPAASTRRNASTRTAVESTVRSACGMDFSSECTIPGSARTGNSRLPRDNAIPTSIEHHIEATMAEVTTHTLHAQAAPDGGGSRAPLDRELTRVKSIGGKPKRATGHACLNLGCAS